MDEILVGTKAAHGAKHLPYLLTQLRAGDPRFRSDITSEDYGRSTRICFNKGEKTTQGLDGVVVDAIQRSELVSMNV